MMRRQFIMTVMVSLLILAGAAGNECDARAKGRNSTPEASPSGGAGIHPAAAPTVHPSALPAATGAAAGRGIRSNPAGAPFAPAAVAGAGTGAASAADSVAASAYTYRSAGKSDPFQPFIETDLALKKKKEDELNKRPDLKPRSLSPLQQVDIEQFRLVGIAGTDVSRMAIVEEGVAKKFYPLFVGTVIGLNGGRVAAILPDRVIVTERIVTESRKVETRRITRMLHKEEEGKP